MKTKENGFIREVCSWPDQAPGSRPGDWLGPERRVEQKERTATPART
jgi:hypothetical protein